MKGILLITALLVLLIGCASGGFTGSPTPSPIETPPSGGEATLILEPDDRRAVFPNTIIVYQREGGLFPGSPQQWTIYHTGRIVAADGTEWQVPATEVRLLFDSVEASDFWGLEDNYAPAGECLDCLVHTLTVYREGEIKEITIVQGLLDLPESLGQVLDEIYSLISE